MCNGYRYIIYTGVNDVGAGGGGGGGGSRRRGVSGCLKRYDPATVYLHNASLVYIVNTDTAA